MWKKLKKTISDITIEQLHEYLLPKSSLLYSFSFTGQQKVVLEKNVFYRLLLRQIRNANRGDITPKFYVWVICNNSVNIKKTPLETFSSDEEMEDFDGNESDNVLSKNLVFSCSIVYCSKRHWDKVHKANYERERTAVSSLGGNVETKPITSTPSFEPGEYSSTPGLRSLNSSRIPAYAHVPRTDLNIDLHRLKLQWNVAIPKDIEKIVGSRTVSLSQSTPISANEARSQRSRILTGSASIRRASQGPLSQETPLSSSRRTPVSSQKEVAPSQEDFSQLFSLLEGSDSSDE